MKFRGGPSLVDIGWDPPGLPLTRGGALLTLNAVNTTFWLFDASCSDPALDVVVISYICHPDKYSNVLAQHLEMHIQTPDVHFTSDTSEFPRCLLYASGVRLQNVSLTV